MNASRAAIDVVGAQLDEAYRAVRKRIEGLSEDEYFWKPAPDCWTVYQLPDGRWTYDYEEPDPEPAPFTTIAWRVIHIATCKVMYHEYAFGAGRLTWDELPITGSVSDAVAMLENGHELLADDLRSLATDDELAVPRLTNWGEKWPTWRIFWTMIWHDAHHGGEIGALRDLYRWARAADGGT